MRKFKEKGRLNRAKKAVADLDKMYNRIGSLIKEEVIYTETTKEDLDKLYVGLEVLLKLRTKVKTEITRMEGNPVLYN